MYDKKFVFYFQDFVTFGIECRRYMAGMDFLIAGCFVTRRMDTLTSRVLMNVKVSLNLDNLDLSQAIEVYQNWFNLYITVQHD
jgi:hypothetical protein